MDDQPFFQLIYTSTATELFDDEVLMQILQAARRNNEKNNLTGMLLYNDGVFMQTLEGEKATVLDTYQTIASDQRHYGVIILRQSSVAERSFPDWSMGFKTLSRQQMDDVSGFTNFLNKDFDASELQKHKSMAVNFMLSFRDNLA